MRPVGVRRALVWLILAMLILGTGTLAAAQPNGKGQSQSESKGKSGEHSSREPGQISKSGNVVDGRYVDFVIEPTLGRVSSITLEGQLVISQILAPARFDFHVRGGRATLEGEDFDIKVTDTPDGLIKLSSKGSPFVVSLPAGARTAAGDGRVAIVVGEHAGFIRGGVLNGSHILVQDGVILLPPGGANQKIVDAIANRKLGAWTQVLEDGMDVLDLENVSVVAQSLGGADIRFLLDRVEPEGKVLAFDFPPGRFGPDLQMRYHDEGADSALVEVHLSKAASAAHVLAAVPADGPVYFVEQDETGTHILLFVPHFSLHAFDVLGIPPEVVPVIVYGLFFGVAVAALAAMGMFRRPPTRTP
jgi:hypothetical protein